MLVSHRLWLGVGTICEIVDQYYCTKVILFGGMLGRILMFGFN